VLKKTIRSTIELLFVLAFSASLYAQEGRWDYLGNAHVDGAQDHDNIHVGQHDGRFRAIQWRVSGGGIYFERVVVHFGNGTQEELVIRDHIPSGGSTRASSQGQPLRHSLSFSFPRRFKSPIRSKQGGPVLSRTSGAVIFSITRRFDSKGIATCRRAIHLDVIDLGLGKQVFDDRLEPSIRHILLGDQPPPSRVRLERSWAPAKFLRKAGIAGVSRTILGMDIHRTWLRQRLNARETIIGK
jgi:hypothetical protein